MRKRNYKGGGALGTSYVAAACILLTVLLAQSVFATTDISRRDTDYKADQVLKSNARINTSTLALEFSIPIGGFAGRTGFGLPISFNYSSKVWQIYAPASSSWQEQYGTIITDSQPLYARRSAAGWTSSLGVPQIDFSLGIYEPYRGSVSNYDGQVWEPYIPYGTPPPPENFYIYYVKRLQVTMPDGSSHEFRKDDTIHDYGTAQSPGGYGLPDLAGVFLSVDGTRMRLEVGSQAHTLYLPDGSRYLFEQGSDQASAFVDRHGNKMNFNLSARQWTDTMGRIIKDPIPFNWGPFEQNQVVGDHTEEFPGKGSDTYDVTFSWRYLKDPQGGESGLENTSLDLRYTSDKYCQGNNEYNLNGPYLFDNPEISLIRVCGGYASTAPRFNPIVLTKISLPNGQKYEFRYNVYGEISKIIYPSGGYERFTHDQVPLLQASMASYEQGNRGVVERWVSPSGDGTDEAHWTYIDPVTGGLLTTSPDGTKTRPYIYCEATGEPQPYGFGNAKTGRPYEETVLSSSGQLLRRKLTKYTWTGPHSGGYAGATRDLRPEREITIIFEPGESNALATMTETVYDTSGSSDPAYFSSLNPKQQRTYRYVVVSASTAATADVDTAAGWFSTSDLATVAEMDYLYDSNYKARNITGLVTETRIKDAAGNIKAKTQISYDDSGHTETSSGTMPTAAANSWLDPLTELGSTIGAKRGLPTIVKSYHDIANSQYIETKSFYDQFGNLRKTRDGRGNDTVTVYDDDFAFAYPTSVTTPVPDSSGTNGSSTAFTSSTNYDYNTGLPVSSTDATAQTTTIEYNDALLRPTKVTAPNGHQTITEYGAGTSASTRWVKARSQIDADKWKEGYTWFDGLGRTVRTQSVDDDGDVFALTCYDNMGRVSKATNPFRGYTSQDCSTTSGLEWTTNTFDTAGRPWKVTTPDGAVVEMTYGLATSGSQIGTVVTVEDQADKQRRSITNALGQLIRVDEPNNAGQLGAIDAPNQDTLYAYNILNNLTTVTQGVQTRTFSYDALSRLKEATNPESGTLKYTYDANSNLKTKWDARGIKTIYDYDALNRVWKRCYKSVGTSSLGSTTCGTASGETTEPNTPEVTYYFDNLTNAKGKLIKVESSVSTTEYTGFDILGRVTASKQTTDGVTYGNGSTDSSMTYTYNLAGAMIEQQYPSGRKVKSVLDNSGDLSLVQSRKNTTSGYWNYASSFTYNAAGAVTSMQLGNGRWESTTFNSRLQPTQIALGATPSATNLLDLDYSYGTTANNGNILSQTITVPTVGSNTGFTAVQNYSYDSLNRLKDAIENITPNGGSQSQSWKQTFTFDRYGNRRFDESNTTMPTSFTNQALTNPTISTSNNRLSSTGWDYDSTGNTTDDPNGREFVYDAENKQVKVTDGADVLGEYWYDGDGRRVRKHVRSTGEVTVFVYDAASKLIAEYSTIVETTNAKVGYVSNDHLGSPRINTDANGAVTSRHDYHPFGEEIATSQRTTGVGYADDMVRKQFTGYERDKETELDYARARMFGYSTGRFTSPDPLAASAKAGIPQSWNRYTYVLNNPLVLVDRTGKKWGYYDDENGKRHFHYFSGNAGKFGGHTYSNYTGPRVLTNTNGGTVRLLDGGRYRVLRPLQTAASSTPRANRATQTNSGYVNHELVNELAKRTENIPAFVGTAMGASAAAGVVCAAACPAAAGLTLTEIAAGGAAAAPEVGFVLSQLPGKDSIIFQEAISGGAAAEAPFIDNLMKLTEAVQRVIGMHANVTKLGEINGSEVFGSNATRIGIASIDGVTMIVNMAGDKPQILGPLQ